jgi:hypothetical protein
MLLNRIAVLNSTTAVSANEVHDWVDAVTIQVNRDYFQGNVKSGTVQIIHVPKGGTAPPDAWWIAVVDNADMAGALGYHDITPTGLPLGKVFVKTTQVYGGQPSVTLSHELLEMLGDPFVNETVSDGEDVAKYWAKEDCDACEADELGYDITLPATVTRPERKVRVSDFVLPAYWNPIATKGPYSFKNNLSGPVPALAPGGYMAFIENGVWSQITRAKSDDPRERLKMRIDSPIDKRRGLRLLPRKQWVTSTARIVG